MKILKYIKYRMQGYTKEETYFNMAINGYCTFEEYKRFYDFKVKNSNKKSIYNSLYGKFVKAGEKDVSDKRNRGHKRKANRT